MNLQRRTHLGAGLTTAVVLLCGIVSGAAMAAGNRPDASQPASAQLRAVPSPTTPSITGIPSIPGVPQPSARTPQMATHIPAPQGVQMLTQQAAVPAQPAAAAVPVEDALVLRPESPYERKSTPQAAQQQTPLQTQQAEPSIANGKPFGGLNLNGLGFFMLALLAAAGFLAYRKKQEQQTLDGDLTLEVASTIRVGPKWQVSLVRVPGRMLVVGATERGLELLTELYPESDEDAIDGLLTAVSEAPTRTSKSNRPVLNEPSHAIEDIPADPFDTLADISPRYDDTRPAGTYNRPPRRQPAAPPTRTNTSPAMAAQTQQPGHDDVFLDAVLDRLSKARPAVIRHTTKPAPRVDERAALRAQVKQYRRGPTRL